jgi:hypothetical protein
VLHVQVGDGSCYGEFDNPNNQASSTWWIAKSGVIEQYVDSDIMAWTEENGNPYFDSVETEGTPDEPLTDAQVLSLARIYVWGVHQYQWPLVLSESPTAHGLGWHGMGGLDWGGHFGCPGDLRKAQRAGALWLASVSLFPPVLVPQPSEVDMLAHCPTGGIVVARPNGSVYCEGAGYYGSCGQVNPSKPPGGPNAFVPSSPIVGVGCTPSGHGYWLVNAQGLIYSFGDAPWLGPIPKYLSVWGVGLGTANGIVGVASDDRGGYTIVTDNPAAGAPSIYHIDSSGQYTR